MIVWEDGLYPKIEKLLFEEGLKFKFNFLSSADVIYQIFCTFRALEYEFDHKCIEILLQEAIFRSYLYTLGKFNFRLLLQQLIFNLCENFYSLPLQFNPRKCCSALRGLMQKANNGYGMEFHISLHHI